MCFNFTRFQFVTMFWYLRFLVVGVTGTVMLNDAFLSPLLRRPCILKGNLTNHAHCGSYFTCGNNGEWQLHYCTYPELFSNTSKTCLPYDQVTCDSRFEPVTPCGYREENCENKKEQCICQGQGDIDFNFCKNKTDGLYPAKSRVSPMYIKCDVKRTILKQCNDQRFVFDKEKRICLNIFFFAFPDILWSSFMLPNPQSTPSLNNFETYSVNTEPSEVASLTHSDVSATTAKDSRTLYSDIRIQFPSEIEIIDQLYSSLLVNKIKQVYMSSQATTSRNIENTDMATVSTSVVGPSYITKYSESNGPWNAYLDATDTEMPGNSLLMDTSYRNKFTQPSVQKPSNDFEKLSETKSINGDSVWSPDHHETNQNIKHTIFSEANGYVNTNQISTARETILHSFPNDIEPHSLSVSKGRQVESDFMLSTLMPTDNVDKDTTLYHQDTSYKYSHRFLTKNSSKESFYSSKDYRSSFSLSHSRISHDITSPYVDQYLSMQAGNAVSQPSILPAEAENLSLYNRQTSPHRKPHDDILSLSHNVHLSSVPLEDSSKSIYNAENNMTLFSSMEFKSMDFDKESEIATYHPIIFQTLSVETYHTMSSQMDLDGGHTVRPLSNDWHPPSVAASFLNSFSLIEKISINPTSVFSSHDGIVLDDSSTQGNTPLNLSKNFKSITIEPSVARFTETENTTPLSKSENPISTDFTRVNKEELLLLQRSQTYTFSENIESTELLSHKQSFQLDASSDWSSESILNYISKSIPTRELRPDWISSHDNKPKPNESRINTSVSFSASTYESHTTKPVSGYSNASLLFFGNNGNLESSVEPADTYSALNSNLYMPSTFDITSGYQDRSTMKTRYDPVNSSKLMSGSVGVSTLTYESVTYFHRTAIAERFAESMSPFSKELLGDTENIIIHESITQSDAFNRQLSRGTENTDEHKSINQLTAGFSRQRSSETEYTCTDIHESFTQSFGAFSSQLPSETENTDIQESFTLSIGTFSRQLSSETENTDKHESLAQSTGAFSRQLSSETENTDKRESLTHSTGAFSSQLSSETKNTDIHESFTQSIGTFSRQLSSETENTDKHESLAQYTGAFSRQLSSETENTDKRESLTQSTGAFSSQLSSETENTVKHESLAQSTGAFSRQLTIETENTDIHESIRQSTVAVSRQLSVETENTDIHESIKKSTAEFSRQLSSETENTDKHENFTQSTGAFSRQLSSETENTDKHEILTQSNGAFSRQLSSETENTDKHESIRQFSDAPSMGNLLPANSVSNFANVDVHEQSLTSDVNEIMGFQSSMLLHSLFSKYNKNSNTFTDAPLTTPSYSNKEILSESGMLRLKPALNSHRMQTSSLENSPLYLKSLAILPFESEKSSFYVPRTLTSFSLYTTPNQLRTSAEFLLANSNIKIMSSTFATPNIPLSQLLSISSSIWPQATNSSHSVSQIYQRENIYNETNKIASTGGETDSKVDWSYLETWTRFNFSTSVTHVRTTASVMINKNKTKRTGMHTAAIVLGSVVGAIALCIFIGFVIHEVRQKVK